MSGVDLNNFRENIFNYAGIRSCPGYGEDGVLKKIFETIGTTKAPYCVEFGELRSLGTTTRYFRINFRSDAFYFSGSLDFKSRVLNILDVFKVIRTQRNLKYFTFLLSQPKNRFIRLENCLELLSPLRKREVDLLVADIDSYDFELVTKIIELVTKPRVLIVEYNPSLPPDRVLFWRENMSRSLSTNPRMYGASYGAWINLLELQNYRLVHISGFCNLIFIRGDVKHEFTQPQIQDEITDTNEKVLEFAARYCLPGFRPSWIDAPPLTEDEFRLLS